MMMMVMMMKQVTVFITVLFLAASVHSSYQFHLPIDCDDIYLRDNTSSSGVYTIYPGGPTAPLHVHCDMDTDGGRWTVFLRRLDGTENFYRPWDHYKAGFGNVAGEYWLGLENIFLLTLRKSNELRVDMEDWQKEKASAHYTSFSVDSQHTGYQLHVDGYTGGIAGNSLTEHNTMKFTTYDKDQDTWDKNCAQHFLGGFWYGACHSANPTGLYAPTDSIAYSSTNTRWGTWKSSDSLKTLAWKIRSDTTCTCRR